MGNVVYLYILPFLYYILTPLLLTICAIKLYSVWKRRSLLNNLPGPKLDPLWGTLKIFGFNECGIKNLENYMNEHRDDKVVRLRSGPFQYVVRIMDPELAGKVLSMGPDLAPKFPFSYSILTGFLGFGLIVLNYNKWYSRRRLLTPAFHLGIIESYMSTYNNTTDVLLKKWESLIGASDDGTAIVDVCREATLYTLDVILQCACSYESNCQLEESSESAREYISAIFDSSKLTVEQITYVPNLLPFYFKLSARGKRWRAVCSRIKQESLKVVQARRRAIVSGERIIKERPDFIDILLTSPDSSGATLSDDDIMSEMNTFLFEGHDTTAAGISWTLYLLGLHVDIQKQCKEEIRSVLGDRKTIEWRDLDALEFTTMCLKESMRLYPPVPFIARTINEDINVDHYIIPKGTAVSIPITLLHRHPKFWENPDKFDPTRFYSLKPGGTNFSYIPFSAGHRNCIGQKFALTEELVAVARVLISFELESIPKEIIRAPHLILKSVGGLKVKLRLV